MATAKKLNLAFVLCDIPPHGVRVGQLIEASPELIQALQADGSVDTAKAAVEAARAAGAQVVRSAIEAAPAPAEAAEPAAAEAAAATPPAQ